jgi:hypothetical protein
VIAGVITLVVALIVVLVDLTSFVDRGGIGAILLGAGFVLLGLGFARLSNERPAPFDTVLGRRGAKWLAAGLLLDSAIMALLGAGGLKGSAAAIAILPLILGGWSTVIGFGLIVLALVRAPAPGRWVGLLFVVAILVLVASNAFTNAGGETTRMIGLGLGAAAACGLLAGFAGIGLVSIRESRMTDPASARSGF